MHADRFNTDNLVHHDSVLGAQNHLKQALQLHICCAG